MSVLPRPFFPLLFASCFAFAAPASADKVTLGSDLTASAARSINDTQLIEAHGADTAFWPLAVKGDPFSIPADGQVISVKLKGTVFKEQGAKDPANLIHFQSLLPAGGDGLREVWLTSQGFYVPIDKPNAVTTFEPENLCVKKGGSVAFNNIGGFKYGGSLDAPLDQSHYLSGAPFAVFGAVADSVTARFTSDEGTKNGATLSPSTANQTPGRPVGTTNRGQELLMQLVVATGQDRSEPCGGPRRHPDGRLVEDPKTRPQSMRVVTPQRPYVTSDGRFQTGVYCGGPAECTGTAVAMYKKRMIASAPFTIAPAKSGRIPMRLKRGDYNLLRKAKGALRISYVLQTSFGTFTTPLTIRH